jgi:hypothetical protein
VVKIVGEYQITFSKSERLLHFIEKASAFDSRLAGDNCVSRNMNRKDLLVSGNGTLSFFHFAAANSRKANVSFCTMAIDIPSLTAERRRYLLNGKYR